MCMLCTRRGFLRAAGATAAAAALPGSLRAQSLRPAPLQANGLPSPAEFVIRGATVLTLDPAIGDLPSGSVHVREGRIAAVGREVQAAGAAEIDGTGMIVLPGLVDTHWHMWHTLFRGLSGDRPPEGFFPTVTRFCAFMEPSDMHASTRLAAAEGLNAGITTVHSWCHNIRSREHAEADVRAIGAIGLRGRWSFGQALDQPADRPIRLADLEAMQRDWTRYAAGGRIGLGMAWRGVFRGNAWLPAEVYRSEFDAARRLGLPITVHIGTLKSSKGHIEAHYKEKLLGPDVNVVHACSASAEEIRMLRDSGASVSCLPHSEMRGGWGWPLLGEFLAAGIPTGIGVDTSALAGSADLFSVMKIAMAAENARAESEFRLTARRALELATIEGARVLGLQDEIGTLTPGKRADLIMVAAGGLNMGVATDPTHLVVESAGPASVDTVVCDGRILKRGGRLTAADPAEVVGAARLALADVRRRAGWR